MDKIFLASVLMIGSIALSACGQRPDGDELQLGAANSAVEGVGVRVITSANSITTGGTESANITALVTDENNNAMAGTNVVFSTSSGILQDISSVTDENGEVSATLSLPHYFDNEDIIVTAEADGNFAEVMVSATGSVVEVSGPDNLVLGDDAEVTIALLAGNDEPIANYPVEVISTADNVITPSSVVTGSDGRVTVMVSTENGDDTLQVSALNGTVTALHSFQVSQDSLRFADEIVNSELPVAFTIPITVTWASQDAPVVGSQLLFSTTAGEIVGDSLITTDANGQATAQLRSSSYGPANITVEDATDGRPRTSLEVEFVAINPSAVRFEASSSRVPINGTSVLSATVLDAQGNPVKNQVVDFSGLDLKGGQINPASARSNSQGIASVTYTAGSNATEIDDIEIVATVKNTAISESLRLSVIERALNVTLGTSNTVRSLNFDTQYGVSFVVQVADGSGAPLENAEVDFSIRPLAYFKGEMIPNSDDESDIQWIQVVTAECETEDTNGNRLMDIGEDANNNGSLDPQDPALIAAISEDAENQATIVGGVLSTDANGSGYFELRYPKSNALWADIEITASARAFGTESRDTFVEELAISIDDIVEIASPPNAVSPYGASNSCADTL